MEKQSTLRTGPRPKKQRPLTVFRQAKPRGRLGLSVSGQRSFTQRPGLSRRVVGCQLRRHECQTPVSKQQQQPQPWGRMDSTWACLSSPATHPAVRPGQARSGSHSGAGAATRLTYDPSGVGATITAPIPAVTNTHTQHVDARMHTHTHTALNFSTPARPSLHASSDLEVDRRRG